MENSFEIIAFDGDTRLVAGPVAEVAPVVRQAVADGAAGPILVFDRSTSELVDLDPTGPAPVRRQAGRPRLGVVAREVTLLPRHWDWLAEQPGGASVTLRRLVEQARRANVGVDRVRRARETAYQFMNAMAGDRPGFEEALRALFAGDRNRFGDMIRLWPADVRDHAAALAEPAFTE